MKIEKLEKSQVKVTIDVTAEEFEKALDKSFEINVQKVSLKGFRKGHVPRNIYEKNFGVESLFEEAINQIIPEKYYAAIKEGNLYPVGDPKFDIKFEDIKRNEAFSFDVIIPVKPEVKLGDYRGLETKAMDTLVSDEEVDKEIDRLLLQGAEEVLKENNLLEAHDIAIFDFDGSVDGVHFDGGKAENYELEILSHQFIPGFEEQMIGMTTEEERDINVKFPENYQAKDLAGKDAVFHIKLHEIKTRVKKDLNDEFVKGLNRDGINTVEELKASINDSIKKQKEKNEKNRVVDELVDKATKNASFEIPDAMIENEKENMLNNVTEQAKRYNMELDMFLSLNGVSKEQFLDDIKNQAEKRVSYELVIAEIMTAEKIEATKDEIDAKYEELAKMYNTDVEKIKKQINPSALAYSIAYEKTIDFLVDNAKFN